MTATSSGKQICLPATLAVLEWLRAGAVCWLLVVGLWSGPAFGASLAYPNGLLEVEIGLAVVLFILWRAGRVQPLRYYPVWGAALATITICALSAGMRLAFRGTEFDGLRLWKLAEPMARGAVLFLALAGQPRLLRLAGISALVGVGLLAAATIIQHLTGVTRWYADLDQGWAGGLASVPLTIDAPRAQGLTSYINLTSAMLGASVALWATPVALRVPPGRWARVTLALGGVATVAALWYTGSRGPLLAITAVLCIFFGALSARYAMRVLVLLGFFLLAVWPSFPWWSLLALGGGVLVFALFTHHPRMRLLLPMALGLSLAGGLHAVDYYLLHLPLQFRLGEQGVADQARLDIDRLALAAIQEAPWWGVGDAEIARRLRNDVENPGLRVLPRTQQNAHNQYLHWAAAEGIPAALCYTLLMVGAVVWCWRQAMRQRVPVPRVALFALAAALSTFLLANLVDAHFWRIEGAGFFWSLFALAPAVLTLPESRGNDVNPGGEAAVVNNPTTC